MKAPAPILAVDAAVLVAAVCGTSTGAIRQADRMARLITTDRAVAEARRRIVFGMRRPEIVPVLDALLANFTIVSIALLAKDLPRGEIVLRDAVPSRNGSVKDAHMIALAWSYDADIWSPDRDFAGTGVASWSTPNLLGGFALSGAASI